jgi:hypothetical protein
VRLLLLPVPSRVCKRKKKKNRKIAIGELHRYGKSLRLFLRCEPPTAHEQCEAAGLPLTPLLLLLLLLLAWMCCRQVHCSGDPPGASCAGSCYDSAPPPPPPPGPPGPPPPGGVNTFPKISGGKQQYENHILRAGNPEPIGTLFCWHGFQ